MTRFCLLLNLLMNRNANIEEAKHNWELHLVSWAIKAQQKENVPAGKTAAQVQQNQSSNFNITFIDYKNLNGFLQMKPAEHHWEVFHLKPHVTELLIWSLAVSWKELCSPAETWTKSAVESRNWSILRSQLNDGTIIRHGSDIFIKPASMTTARVRHNRVFVGLPGRFTLTLGRFYFVVGKLFVWDLLQMIRRYRNTNTSVKHKAPHS